MKMELKQRNIENLYSILQLLEFIKQMNHNKTNPFLIKKMLVHIKSLNEKENKKNMNQEA